ncbi:MAG TPA: pyridoxamine 5'-phosphate oxidase family protein [Flavobacteriaceae bacterium]|jgi:nitroimidazol reductase NimA-like FMN-containing flavoprotein (pyridoxamine 5'-phosphate oxidase superfamily)|nr:pyridoxamine 5'-phosphate oxidase family protein [Flavobacteriaceae bacterium]
MMKKLKKTECLSVLQNNYIGHLSYIYLKRPYIVPMTYFFDKKTDTIICYSAEGHKIKSMRKNGSVSFEVTEIESVHQWKSVLAHGTYEELSGSNVKLKLHVFSRGVKKIIKRKEHRELNFISEFSSKIYKNDLPIAFLIKIDDITGKGRNTTIV